MSRELDEQCARAMGLEIVHSAWPCGVPPDGCSPEAAARDDDGVGSWFDVRGPIYKVHEPLDEWKDELGVWCAPIPAYSTDYADARTLEAEIERRGLQSKYSDALYKIAYGEVSNDEANDMLDLWLVIRATPEQRARAFLEAVKP